MSTKSREEWRRFVRAIAQDAPILDVAARLDLRVIPTGGGRGRTLCPFHEDRDPSLTLYPGGGGGPASFHCFGCGEHGDVYDLVKRRQGVGFPEAVRWLADLLGRTVPAGRLRRAAPEVERSAPGLRLAHEHYLKVADDARLEEWARARQLPADLLRSLGVAAVEGNALWRKWLEPRWPDRVDREELDALVEAGLLRPRPRPGEQTGSGWLLRLYSDFFREPRILFSLWDLQGRLRGLAGRLDEEPAGSDGRSRKYLYTPGFRRADVLFGADRVRRSLEHGGAVSEQPVHLFVVEGIVDALRLTALDLHAVAVLGSALSEGQVAVLAGLAEVAERHRRVLHLHVYLDVDEAGRKGTRRALPRLLEAAVEQRFTVDVVASPVSAGKDPDEQLRGRDQAEAWTTLSHWTCSPTAWLVWDLLGLAGAPEDVAGTWAALTPSRRFEVVRRLEWLAPRRDRAWWPAILERLDPFAAYLDDPGRPVTPPAGPEAWTEGIRRALLGGAGIAATAVEPEPEAPARPLRRSDTARLLLATQLAEASAQRREVPDDPGSWDRLRTALGAFLPVLRARLAHGRGELLEPMRCALVPKDDGRIRRKLMPCPEDLVLQQFMLAELLCADGRAAFAERIPAVRYSRCDGRAKRWTTGATDGDGHPTGDAARVSFAYQVDMDILEGRLGASREGMFRPYYECWREYVDYVLSRVRRSGAARLFAARLDIRSFYDSVPRYAINDALVPALEEALQTLGSEQYEDFARLLGHRGDERGDAGDLARRFVNWLCDQVVAAPFLDETSGDVRRGEHLDRGLAQGPDLSAYLANIVLFRLDGRISQAVRDLDARGDAQAATRPGRRATGGIYARYVDDIILMAPSQADLRSLRSLVELELARLGLELKPEKSEQLRPMSSRELSAFLVAERSAGRARYGDREAPPDAPLAHWNDPLAGAGDRSEALTFLHDPRLERAVLVDGGTDPAGVRRQLRHALRAPELRYGDRVTAARHAWALAAVPESPDGLALRFLEEWDRLPGSRPSQPTGDASADAVQQVAPLLVWLDALERVLERRPGRNPLLDGDEQRRWEALRRRVAEAVLDRLGPRLEELWRRPDEAGASERDECLRQLRHLLDSRMLVLEASAARIVGARSPARLARAAQERPSWAQARMYVSLAAELRHVDLLSDTGLWLGQSAVQEFVPEVVWLHEAVARLHCWDGRDPDPLWALAERAGGLAGSERGRTKPAVRELAAVLAAWLPDGSSAGEAGTDDVDDGPERLELALALVNATGWEAARFAGILSSRPLLLHWLWEDEAVGPPLPTPAELRPPGLLHQPKGERGSVHRLEPGGEEIPDQEVSPNVAWVALPPPKSTLQTDAGEPAEEARRRIIRKRSEEQGLVAARCREPNAPLSVSEEQTSAELRTALRWVAETFRRLATVARGYKGGALRLLPTAQGLLGPSHEHEVGAGSDWSVLSYCFEEDALGSQAFFRPGASGIRLQARRVQADHAGLWRIGVALADYLGETDIAGEGKRVRATAPGLGVDEGEDPDEASARWAARSVLRHTLYRLTGSSQPPGELRAAPDSFLPATVARTLEHVDLFLALPLRAGAAAVVAFGAESAALELLATAATPLDVPGAPAWLLARAATAAVAREHGLRARLPAAGLAWEPPRPLRRGVQAWRQVAGRVEALRGLVGDDSVQSVTRPVVAGLCLHALGTQLRAQALEQWAELSPGARQRLADSPPTLADWGLDERCLVLADAPVDEPEGSQEEPGLLRLFAELCHATAPDAVEAWDALSQITALGWLVVLGVAAGLSPGEAHGHAATRRPATPDEETGWIASRDALGEALSALAGLLSVEPEQPGGFPGRESLSFPAALSIVDLDHWLGVLAGVDDWLGTTVEAASAGRHPLRRGGMDDRSQYDFEATRDRRTHCVEQWQVQQASLGAEAGPEIERHERPDGGPEYVWTETWRDGRLVGVSLVRPRLALLAGLEQPPAVPEGSRSAGDAESGPDGGTSPGLGPAPAAAPGPRAAGELAEACAALRQIQRKVWRERRPPAGKAGLGSVRVALFQWDLDHSYFSPVVTDLCGDDSDARGRNVRGVIDPLQSSRELPCRRLRLRREPYEWTTHHQDFPADSSRMPSCAEFRRRRLLASVLSACHDLGVRVLLLPEYSVRWDTLAWLLETGLPAHAPSLSVWAGTYLRAHGTPPLADLPGSVGTPPVDPPEWSAVLTALVRCGEGRHIRARGKKYPAIALSEEFRPSSAELSPLFDLSTERHELLSFVTELICSEVFVAMSPANWIPMVAACRDLLRQHGVPYEEARRFRDTLFEDLWRLSLDFAMTSLDRRSILLVPALTRRATDYQVFAQANYLAAGITTVFCNAVVPAASKGQSCFVGHGGWDHAGGGAPPPSPYHGPLPGVFAQSRVPRGCLGEREQALVVADVDPRYALEGRPRPQGLPQPLRLVAHLPILESWSRRQHTPQHWCRCLRSGRRARDWGAGGRVEQLVARVLAACQRTPRPENTGVDSDLSATVRLLDKLARAVPNSPGLCERAKAHLRYHRSRPQAWPPPALVDWLCVDPGPPETWADDEPVDVWMPPFRDVIHPGPDPKEEPGE